MPTNKPRFSVTADTDLIFRINAYQHAKGLESQSQAVIELINIGLLKEVGGNPIPVFSREEMTVLHAFRFAHPQYKTEILSLASKAEFAKKKRYSHLSIPSPQFDSIALLQGYEMADDDTRKKIDQLIAESIQKTMVQTDDYALLMEDSITASKAFSPSEEAE